jgi:hypothetical protein
MNHEGAKDAKEEGTEGREGRKKICNLILGREYQSRVTRMPYGVLIKPVQELGIYDTSHSNSTTLNSVI